MSSYINTIEGAAEATSRIIPPGVPSQPTDFKIEFDPEKALALLNQSGLEPFDVLKLTFANEGNNQQVVEIIAIQLKELFDKWASEHGGQTPEITLEGLELREFSRVLNDMILLGSESAVQLYYSFWGADYPDPQNLLSQQLETARGNNNGRYSNDQFDALVGQADKMILTDPKRSPVYRDAEVVALGDIAWVPLFNPPAASLIRPGVTGLVVTSQGIIIPDFSAIQVPV